MKLLVTGSAGFIGSAFVRMLLGKSFHPANLFPRLGPDDRIVSLDLLTYAASMEALAPIASDPRHQFIKGDIRDRRLVESLVVEHQLDGILNFAAESHVDRSIEGSAVFAETNILGTLNLLEVARLRGLRFLQVSTDEVYGALGNEGSFTEKFPLEPNSPYSASKAGADCFVRAFVETHKLEAVITRCSNNYGPYQFPEKFLPLAITRLLRGGKIPIYGQGLNVRDWLHVEDHVHGIWLAYQKGKPGDVFNLGGFGEVANIEMARKLAAALGKDFESNAEYVVDRKGHDWRYSMDSALAQRELGWKPQWTLEAGLKHMVGWYQEESKWWEGLLARAT